MASAAYAGRAKKGWYENSGKALETIFGEDTKNFVGLLSALSPQTSVESNLKNALNVWKNWIAAGRPQDDKTILDIMAASVEGGGTHKSVLKAWRNNTYRALTEETPRLSGGKVESFQRNLKGEMNELTQDAWMANFANMDQAALSGSKKIGGTTYGTKSATYKAYNINTRKAAEILTKKTGEDWTPAEIQETVWSWAKALYEKGKATNQTGLDILKADDLSHTEIDAVADFANLLVEDNLYRKILEDAGYGKQLKQLDKGNFKGHERGGAVQGVEGTTIDPESHRRNLERGAKRLDNLASFRKAESSGVSGKYTKSDFVKAEPQAYAKAMKAAKYSRGDSGALVDTVSALEVKRIQDEGGKVYLSKDGMAGGFVKADGEMGGLFGNAAGKSGAAKILQEMRINDGGKYFNSFAQNNDRYVKNGWKPVSRIKFDESQAPKNWKDNAELAKKPDVIFYAYDPVNAATARPKLYDDWGDASNAAIKEADGLNVAKAETAHWKAFDTFFEAVVEGDPKYMPSKPFEYTKQFKAPEQKFEKTFDKYMGNFDKHIATSIPTFRDIQVAKGSAIVKTYPEGARMVDLGASEGGFNKAITKESGGAIKTVALDANPKMHKAFNKDKVDGAVFEEKAFQYGWDNIETYKPKEKFDVVHESMLFQFINKERKSKIKHVFDDYLKDDGILITEQKFKIGDMEKYKANETLKNTKHKNQYYTKEQLEMKTDEVLMGMDKHQAEYDDYLKELQEQVGDTGKVATYWTSGNFRGIIASKNAKKVDEFLKNLDTVEEGVSEFTAGGNK